MDLKLIDDTVTISRLPVSDTNGRTNVQFSCRQ